MLIQTEIKLKMYKFLIFTFCDWRKFPVFLILICSTSITVYSINLLEKQIDLNGARKYAVADSSAANLTKKTK